MVLDITIRNKETRNIFGKLDGGIQKEKNYGLFKDKIFEIENWHIEGDGNVMLNEMFNTIRRVIKEILGESKGVSVANQGNLVVEWGGAESN